MWIFDYIPKELSVILHRKPLIREFNGKKFFIGHGDGLGPHDTGYKLIKKMFSNKVCQWLFARLHPNFGIGFARYWSGRSRLSNMDKQDTFLGEENEWLAIYCKEKLKEQHIRLFHFRYIGIFLLIQRLVQHQDILTWENGSVTNHLPFLKMTNCI